MENDPPAQGQNEASVEQSNTQTRIDEIVKQLNGYKRDADSLRELTATQQATIASLQARQAAPVEQVPAFEMDPEDKKKIDYVVEQATAPLRREMAQLGSQLRMARSEPQVNAVQAKLEKLNNPAITKRTNELIAMWKSDGRLGTAYVAGDALDIAAGQFALGQLEVQRSSDGERKDFNNGFAPLSNPGGRAAPRATQAKKERDVTEMDPEELQAFIAAQNRANPDGSEI